MSNKMPLLHPVAQVTFITALIIQSSSAVEWHISLTHKDVSWYRVVKVRASAHSGVQWPHPSLLTMKNSALGVHQDLYYLFTKS